MPRGRQPTIILETEEFGGVNNAVQFSQIPRRQARVLKNAVMRSIKSIGKRDGTIPVTISALGAPIEYLTVYRDAGSDNVLAASGTTLYEFDGTDTLTAQTMTDTLESAEIYTVAFTDADNTSILFICDGGNMKQYDGTEVKDIVPAADDPSPAPPNSLTAVNAKHPIYCWVYSSHIFLSDGTDIAWYSKRFYYDYIPSVQFERWVRENDYITGPGIAYNNVCLIPMRKGWGFLSGSTLDDFSGNQFINTVNGCVAARSIQKITYPTGVQTIAYLSDNGVHEIFDTGAIDAGSRQYATRFLMQDKVNFLSLGLSEAELSAAVAYFDVRQSFYLLSFTKGGNYFTYAYDTRNGEWYPDWVGFEAEAFVRNGANLYFAGTSGHLHKFDSNLNSDWDDVDKSTGTPIDFDRYGPAIAFEFSGYDSVLDAYLVESKQWTIPATLDISLIFRGTTEEIEHAIKNQTMVWDVAEWDNAAWANIDYSDPVNEPTQVFFYKRFRYLQTRWRNNRDEPVEIFKEKFFGRTSGRG